MSLLRHSVPMRPLNRILAMSLVERNIHDVISRVSNILLGVSNLGGEGTGNTNCHSNMQMCISLYSL